jgi:CysZ protein
MKAPAVSPSLRSARPGFSTGVVALLRGFRFLVSTPASWPYALVPSLVLLALISGAAWLCATFVFPAILERLPSASSKLGELAWLGASGVVALAAFVLAALVALALAAPLSGPALERIVTLKEQALGVPARAAQGFLQEIWCGFRAQIFVLFWLAPLLGLLWIVELALPPAAVVTMPAKLVIASFALAWNLLDYPLTLRGVRMRERVLIFQRFKLACLGFGATFSALFWIPCGCQIVLLPVAAAAATDLVWELLASDPSLLPELERPMKELAFRKPNALGSDSP